MAATTMGRAGQRATRHRRLLLVLGSGAAIAATLAALATACTKLETYSGASEVPGTAPAWSAPCFRHEPRHDRQLLARCARATGVVSYVRRSGSTHVHEVHFALVGRFGALIVKLGDPSLLRTPAVGSRVTVVGALVRADNDMREIEAWSLH
jgi:hypothetical protein